MPGPIPGPPPRRLGGLRAGSIRRPPRPPKPKAPAAPPNKCPNPSCTDPQIVEEDGMVICKACFTQISEANIVAEITFEEQAGGRATVQGGTVNDNSRHAKSLGQNAFRKVGGGERNTLADIQNAGRRALEGLCPKLGITEQVSVQANQIWTLAANINFSAGRRTDEVVAACLYAACRRQKDNQILLMDIAELLQINVFRLGEVYKDLCKDLYFHNESVGTQHMIELEPLIFKYCDKLQFAEKTKDVAQDALRIIRRMNRDWIVSGRHPAGLCGACIILAARMNNFRRTVREVVFVSKVADITIAKRVEEFRRTKSAGLSVEEFRLFGNRMKYQHDPPAMVLESSNGQKLARAKARRAEHMAMKASQERDSQTPISVAGPSRTTTPATSEPTGTAVQQTQSNLAQENFARADQSLPTSTTTIMPPATQNSEQRRSHEGDDQAQETAQDRYHAPKRKRLAAPVLVDPTLQSSASQQEPRFDSDGFAIPALPATNDSICEEIDLEIETSPPSKRGRGRPKKVEAPTVIISEEELAEEDYLEQQIDAFLHDGEVQEVQTEVEKAKEEQRIVEEEKRASLISAQQQAIEAETLKADREARGQNYWGETPGWEPGVEITAEDLEAEFANDPEVNNCLLSEREATIKTQIWVAHNEDWLRKQAEREMLAKVAKATGSNRGRKKNAGKGKKRSKMGDGSVLTESSTPIETPEDAAKAMLDKRAPMKSQNVDYAVLQRIYGRRSQTPSQAGDSRAGTPATPTRPQGTAASPDSPDEADDDEEDDTAINESSLGIPQAATWLNIDTSDDRRKKGPEGDQQEGEEDEEEEDYRRAVNFGAPDQDEDEFGGIPGGFEDEGSGDEYE